MNYTFDGRPIIAIEGGDNVGKTTIGLEILRHYGELCQYVSFPFYENFTGREIREILQAGRADRRVDLDYLFSLNRLQCLSEMDMPEKTRFLLFDRYFASNVAYGPGPASDNEAHLIDYDVETLKLPTPLLTILIKRTHRFEGPYLDSYDSSESKQRQAIERYEWMQESDRQTKIISKHWATVENNSPEDDAVNRCIELIDGCL